MTDPVRRRRSYTKHDRAEVVGMSEAMGIRPASRQAHVPESTIRVWRAREDIAQLRAEKHDEVVADVWGAFQLGIKRIIELIPDTDDLSKVAVATGIVYDKLALMSGRATSRSEHIEITDGLDDHERETLTQIIREATEVVHAGD